MGKPKILENLRKTKDFEDFAEDHGIHYSYTNGGHNYHINARGQKMFFSTHDPEPNPGLRHSLIKQIRALAIPALVATVVLTACMFL